MNEQPLISIITVNYNGCTHTLDLLKSIQQLSYSNVEVIVVDNCSVESVASIREQYPSVQLICLDKNLGFAGGNNVGIRSAKGSYFYLVNNDTVLPKDCLEPLLQRAIANPKAGIICPKILYYDNPSIIQFAGYTPIHPVTIRNRGIGYMEKDEGQYNTAYTTALAHGAAMFIPKAIAEKVGLMAELFFLYYEETDYCEHMKRAGFEIWYEPASTILHKESMSVGKESVLKAYYMSRNRLLYLRRNVKWPTFLLSLLYYFLIAVPKNCLVYLLHKQFKHFHAYVKGVWWNCTHYKDIHENPILSKTNSI